MRRLAVMSGALLALAAAAFPTPAEPRGGSQHVPAGARGGAASRPPHVPGLTPQGRFVHGPAYGHRPVPVCGHRPLPGKPHARPHFGRRIIAAPLIVPVYSYYGAPWPPAAPPEESLPPPIAYAPPPPATETPVPRVIEQPPIPPAPETPIYYCAATNGYTNNLALLTCPGTWERVSP
jgi:hypothetical protein